MDGAADALNAALGALVRVVDRSALARLVTEVASSGLAPAGHTIASWNTLREARQTAEAVLAAASPSQAAIDQAFARLTEALLGLAPSVPTAKSGLAAAITSSTSDVGAEASYTPASWSRYAAALTAAQAVARNPQATQAQVDAALANLTAAIGGLRAHSALAQPDPTPTPSETPVADVNKVVPSLVATVAKASVKAGKRPKVSITVKASGVPVAGTARITSVVGGTTQVAEVVLPGSGKAVFTAKSKLTKTERYSIKVEYLGNDKVAPVTAKALYAPKVTAKLAKSAIPAKTSTKVTVSVRSYGQAYAKGKVKVEVLKSGKVVATKSGSVKSTKATGSVTVPLPKLAKGTYQVRVTYAGNAMVAAKVLMPKTLKVG
jgi:hypothetical protein